MKSLLTLTILGVGAFAAGALATAAALVIGGVALLSSSGAAVGGAFDPITAGLAVGLGGLALKHWQTPEVA